MHPSQIPEKPLVASPNTKVEQPKKIFFFERENGTVLNTDERDAWNLLQGRNQIVGQRPERFKLIGVGKGEIYFSAIKEAQQLFTTEGLKAAQDRLRKGLDDELAAARGTIEMPKNWDTIGPNGVRVDLNLLR